MCPSQAYLRYNRRLIIVALVYAALLIASTYGFKHHLMSPAVTLGAALLLAASLMGNFVVTGLYLSEEKDEYLRMLMTQRMLWATGCALGIATVWGYLQSFGLVGAVAAYNVCLLWYGGLALGHIATMVTQGRAR